MAGYKVFKSTNKAKCIEELAEIGITFNGNDTFTFSDGKTAKWTNYVPDNNCIIADDDAHFIYVAAGTDMGNAAIVSTDTRDKRPVRVIAEDMDGQIIAMGDSGSENLVQNLNTSHLLSADSDASRTELSLVPLAGNFEFNNDKHVFKSLYINYHRWFNFGDIIVSSNGDRYIGIGWILHKIGGGQLTTEYTHLLTIKEVLTNE